MAKWQSWVVRIILSVLTLAVMTMIFFFSSEDAAASDRTSGMFSETVIRLLYPDFADYSPDRQAEVYGQVQTLVRKLAHFSEYAVLGFLLRCCILSWIGPGKHFWIPAWGAGTLYAMTDELHQMLIDGRSGQVQDVLLDSSGVLTGVILASLLLRRVTRS